jgi:fumarylacetoacetase
MLAGLSQEFPGHAMIDVTHDKSRRSWVVSANGHSDFPIQNLPFGVFRPKGAQPRGGVAIGDEILALDAALDAGLFAGEAERAAEAATGALLNPLMALGTSPRCALRKRLSEILDADGPDAGKIEALAPKLLHKISDCVLELPADIGGYTDFFAGIHHATNTGRLFRPENPLLPNYKYIPVAYHGRASSIRPSDTPIRRPRGQRKSAGETSPSFGPCRNLDYELELGIWLGPGNQLGEPIATSEAADHVVGLCLLNDWSARDVQSWESQPLGPFLAKNFATTISPWVVTVEALAPFRKPQATRPDGDPKPLDYLWDETDQRSGAFDIELEALILTEGLRAKGLPPERLTRGNATDLYWTIAQMVAHHSCGGCNLNAGDLFGSGTISGTNRESFGSLLELTMGGRQPLTLASGETRRFLEDGDEVIFRAHCHRDGYVPIGFGECRGRITPT